MAALLDGLDRDRVNRRFWTKVSIPSKRACWPWTASGYGEGYGGFQLGVGRGCVGAHRVAWEIVCGPVEDGQFVLHRCDNRRCCNPGHLFLGTHADNMTDMAAKGRSIKGRRFGLRNPAAIRNHLKNSMLPDWSPLWCKLDWASMRNRAKKLGLRPCPH